MNKRWEKVPVQVPDTDCDGWPMTADVALMYICRALRGAGHDPGAALREHAGVEDRQGDPLDDLAEKVKAYRARMSDE